MPMLSVFNYVDDYFIEYGGAAFLYRFTFD